MNISRPIHIYGQISKYTCLRNINRELNTWGRIMVIFNELSCIISNVNSILKIRFVKKGYNFDIQYYNQMVTRLSMNENVMKYILYHPEIIRMFHGFCIFVL